MAARREEAQRRRAEARRQRRGASDPADAVPRSTQADQSSPPADEGDGHETAKQAAKLAAAGAAVGAAVGAASALAGRDGGDQREQDRPSRARSRAGERPQEEDDEGQAPEPSHDEEERRPESRPSPREPEEPPQVAEQEPWGGAGTEAGTQAAADEWPDDRATRDEDEQDAESVPLEGARRFVESAREQLRALRGVEAETVSALRHDRDGWAVTLEVVEVERIPSSTDVLASYEVVVDEDGDLVRYERRGRYYRGRADEERTG